MGAVLGNALKELGMSGAAGPWNSADVTPSFIGRFLQHVLPPGFKRIRHYGLLSAATKSKRLAQARKALAMPAPDAQACEDATAFLKRVTGIEVSCCAHCRLGHWRTVEALPPERGSRAPTSHACRGPP